MKDRFRIIQGKTVLCDIATPDLCQMWEAPSDALELLQMNPRCAQKQAASYALFKTPKYSLRCKVRPTSLDVLTKKILKPRVAILREEGSNGDREMASAFYHAGFEPWDVNMQDLLNGVTSLDDFRGVAFVGGFSYADVLDSAKGWAGIIRFNARLRDMFERFYRRPDIFSLGVCNGCQLMALLGWVPYYGIAEKDQPRFIRNISGRFESRWANVRILPSPSIMLRDLENSVLGIWIAHGEGRLYCPQPDILHQVMENNLAPVVYVDPDGQATEIYPYNPNGSSNGVTALCSPDGRHLALMPHPERTFLKWQWAWMPQKWKSAMKVSPWLKMFQNARIWCEKNP